MYENLYDLYATIPWLECAIPGKQDLKRRKFHQT